MHVELVDQMGDDLSVVRAARVSTGTDKRIEPEGAPEALIRFLMSNRHASPFEHVTATFRMEVPIFVAREWMRHRTQSFNEESGRYRELEPHFYQPSYEHRPVKQMGKPGAYDLRHGHHEQRKTVRKCTEQAYRMAWDEYCIMLEEGIAREVARMVLPVGIYTSFYATANLRNWFNFLALRTEGQAMFEIRQAAQMIEVELEKVAPISLACWQEYGRGQL